MAKRNANIKIKVENLPGILEKIELLTAERDAALAALQRVGELAEALNAEAAEDNRSPHYKRWYKADALASAASRIRRVLDEEGTDA